MTLMISKDGSMKAMMIPTTEEEHLQKKAERPFLMTISLSIQQETTIQQTLSLK